MVILNIIVSIYYNVIIAYTVFYFFSSLTFELPWKSCDNFWNNQSSCSTTFSKLTWLFYKMWSLFSFIRYFTQRTIERSELNKPLLNFSHIFTTFCHFALSLTFGKRRLWNLWVYRHLVTTLQKRWCKNFEREDLCTFYYGAYPKQPLCSENVKLGKP